MLGADPSTVSMKAKSTDHLGALGRGEGIAALAVVLLVGGE
jgi:2C-methyl-D-erythritol 2,4-cyclodiphosphate synthase